VPSPFPGSASSDGDSGRLGREGRAGKGKGMAVFMSETLCSSILTAMYSLAIYFLINKILRLGYLNLVIHFLSK
jgi:hypothetical protein